MQIKQFITITITTTTCTTIKTTTTTSTTTSTTTVLPWAQYFLLSNCNHQKKVHKMAK